MAYDADNPPVMCVPRLGSGTGDGTTTTKSAAIWTYTSADPVATVIGADYFSDGDDLGMKVNDVVIVCDDNTPQVTLAMVTAVTAGGAATVQT